MSRAHRLLRTLLVFAGLLLTMRAQAQYPQGQQTGSSPQSSGALVTLALPLVVGMNVAYNFVLDFTSGTKCWGASSTQGTFPQAASGTTTYTFVAASASIPNTNNVACPGAGAGADLATVQVFSTLPAASKLQASIADGGEGGQTTKFTDLIADIFSANRLQLTIPGGDACGGGTKASPFNLGTVAASEVTNIPKTGWSLCRQTLSLSLDAATPIAAGAATGTLTLTMVNP